MLIGLSLSLCIDDILKHKVELENVRYLITSTMCDTTKQFNTVLSQYAKSYWRKHSAIEYQTICHYFWENDLIYQPRCDQLNPPRYECGQFWIEVKDDLIWK